MNSEANVYFDAVIRNACLQVVAVFIILKTLFISFYL